MKPNPALFAIVLTSAAIAALAPFDVAFAAVTFNSQVLRVVLMASMALSGALLADRSGLRLEGHSARFPVLIGIAAAAFVAAYVLAIDGFLFRSQLSESLCQTSWNCPCLIA